MLDFEIQRCSRRCAATDRELTPGEWFYSVLLAEGGDVVRRDFAADAWQGPPEEAIGWWKSQMPSPDAKKMHWAPNDVMLHYFEQLEGREDKQDVRYVLALLMVRRRIMKLEESVTEDEQEILVLYCPRNENQYRVPVVNPTPEQVEQIQEELAQLLFADATT